MKKTITKTVCAFFLITLLCACSDKPAQVSQTIGVGRDDEAVPTPAPPAETQPSVPTVPDPFDELQKDEDYSDYAPRQYEDIDKEYLTSLNSIYGIPFEDQPDDWYFGSTERNPATGEVKYIWDRYASTLSILDKYNAVYRGDDESKVCYITFDSGYEYGTTAKILDTLKEKNAPAAFFVNGHFVESSPNMVRRMIDEGHIIGNHADNHYNLTTVDAQTFVSELSNLETKLFLSFPDVKRLKYFRPPSGSCNEWVLSLAYKMGYRTILWSWAYYDYNTDNQPPVADTLDKVMAGLHNGSVILLHTESQTNADMLGEMIDRIRDAGYEIGTLDDIN